MRIWTATMNVTISPHALSGTIPSIASKSVAHRILILAALCPTDAEIACSTTSVDIDATIRCLNALGAAITPTEGGYHVAPIPAVEERTSPRGNIGRTLECEESGSTLRFLLPVVAALGCGAHFTGHGRLAKRPLSPLYELLQQGGCSLSPQGTFPLDLSGKLQSHEFILSGNVSSQFVTGLLMAASVMDGPVKIVVAEPIQSRPYIDITLKAMADFGIKIMSTPVLHGDKACVEYTVTPTHTPLTSPGLLTVEGDWSNAAFWLSAGAIGTDSVCVTNMNLSSVQGDRYCLAALALFGARINRAPGQVSVSHGTLSPVKIDVHDIPDLVPVLAVVAAYAQGETRFTHAERLRLKESDRLESTADLIRAMGGEVATTDSALTITGHGGLHGGGPVDAANDHRIAMAAAIAATCAEEPTKILGAECVSKSYPSFFEDFQALGGLVKKEV